MARRLRDRPGTLRMPAGARGKEMNLYRVAELHACGLIKEGDLLEARGRGDRALSGWQAAPGDQDLPRLAGRGARAGQDAAAAPQGHADTDHGRAVLRRVRAGLAPARIRNSALAAYPQRLTGLVKAESDNCRAVGAYCVALHRADPVHM
jgi:hypothetical protein